MHLNCFLQSQTPLRGGRHTRLTVTDAHLQQKKYEVNNPKVSSPEMWLAGGLADLGVPIVACSEVFLKIGS